jgi:hypothetical protein
VLGLGVLDIHNDFIEPAELVRDLEVAYRKLPSLVGGGELAKRSLGL